MASQTVRGSSSSGSQSQYYDPMLTPRVQPNAHDPTKAWEELKVKQIVKSIEPQSHDVPKPEGHIRMVCISDTHDCTDNLKLPDGDILVHAGDFSDVGLEDDIHRFTEFLTQQHHKHKIVIAGNHDLTFDTDNYDKHCRNFAADGHRDPNDSTQCRDVLLNANVCTYLEDSEVTVEGYRIYGSPWQPEFCNWAFNLRRGEQCLQKWDLIPEGIDNLITHGPPLGHGDLCSSNVRAGYGLTTDGVTTYVNASTCNSKYQPVNPPIIIDLPVKH